MRPSDSYRAQAILSVALALVGLLAEGGVGVPKGLLWAAVGPMWRQNGLPVSVDPDLQNYVGMVRDGADGVILFWEDQRDQNFTHGAQRIAPDSTALWTPNGSLYNLVGYLSFEKTTLAADGAGGAILVWRAASDDIYAQRFSALGEPQWSPTTGVPVCVATAVQGVQAVMSDGAGGAFVAWSDGRGGAFTRDIYVQHLDASGNRLWGVGGLPACTRAGDQAGVAIVPDGAGGVILSFGTDFGPPYNQYAQRLNASGSPLWTANGKTVCTATGYRTRPLLIGDGAGGAYLAWLDQRQGPLLPKTYVQHLDANGDPLLLLDGKLFSGITTDALLSSMASDEAGGAIIAFYEFRDGSYNLCAQRMAGNGDFLWAPSGAVVCEEPEDQEVSAMIPDGAGGVLLAWLDYRSREVSGGDLYAQRLNSNGARLWQAAGVAVCTAPGDPGDFAIQSDASGGAFISWVDYRSDTEGDIYAQRVNDTAIVEVGPGSLPVAVALTAPAPNPATRLARMTFTLPEPTRVRLTLQDVSGRELRIVLEGVFGPGDHHAFVDRLKGTGAELRAGLYFLRLEALGTTSTRKLIVLD